MELVVVANIDFLPLSPALSTDEHRRRETYLSDANDDKSDQTPRLVASYMGLYRLLIYLLWTAVKHK